jgi:hypothetical protein
LPAFLIDANSVPRKNSTLPGGLHQRARCPDNELTGTGELRLAGHLMAHA